MEVYDQAVAKLHDFTNPRKARVLHWCAGFHLPLLGGLCRLLLLVGFRSRLCIPICCTLSGLSLAGKRLWSLRWKFLSRSVDGMSSQWVQTTVESNVHVALEELGKVWKVWKVRDASVHQSLFHPRFDVLGGLQWNSLGRPCLRSLVAIVWLCHLVFSALHIPSHPIEQLGIAVLRVIFNGFRRERGPLSFGPRLHSSPSKVALHSVGNCRLEVWRIDEDAHDVLVGVAGSPIHG